MGHVLRVTVEMTSGFFQGGENLGWVDVWNVTPGLEDGGVADYEWRAYQGGRFQTRQPIANGELYGHRRADGWAALAARAVDAVRTVYVLAQREAHGGSIEGMDRTCRDAVLDALVRLERRHGRNTFALADIVTETLAGDPTYAESTVRTHVTSRMCADAPDNHGTVYADLERVGRGQYRRR